MKYSINGGRKFLFFETELQISSYSQKDPERSFSVGRSSKKGYEEIGRCWFESRYIHFHVIDDTIYITISSEEAIRPIREMLEKTGIEVKGNLCQR